MPSPISGSSARAVARPPRFFYGWWIVAVCAGGMFMHNGVGFYTFGVFLPEFVREFHDRTAVSGAATLFQFTLGVAAPVYGWATDRIGARFLMPLGALIAGLGLILVSRAGALWHLYAGEAVLALGVCGLSTVVVGPSVASWFVRRRALATGIAISFLSLAGTVFLPLDTWLIGQLGWRPALLTLALLVWSVMIPFPIWRMRRRPADLGLAPDGDPVAAHAVRHVEPGLSARAAVRTSAFWAIVAAFVLLIFSMTGLLQHQISYLRDLGFEPGEAAFFLAITTTTSVLSRVALGLISERMSKKYLVCGCMVLQAFAIAAIVLFPARPVILLSMVAFGLTLAAFGILQPLIMAEFFGAASLGAIMGFAALFSNGLTGFGAVFAGALREGTGSYATPFLAFTVLELLAAATVLLARKPALKKSATP